MDQYQLLFSSLKVGSVELKNRIVFPPHSHAFPQNSDSYFGYYEARARGGVGAVTLSGDMPKGELWPSGFYNESMLAGYRRTVEAIHKHGAKVFIQLSSLGAMAGPSYSSDVPHAWVRIQCREAATDEMEAQVCAFGELATIVQSVGIDGVELHGSHGVGIHQTLSPLFNHRTDKYGGTLENRMRFLLECIAAIRKACGRDLVLGVRLDGDESAFGGHSVEDVIEIGQRLEATGEVDYLSVDVAIGEQENYLMMPSSYLPGTPELYAAAAVRSGVSIPVIGVGRITSPELAEQVLQEGQVDLVGVCRALIADPEWPNKSRSGARNQIRECIGDVEGCVGRVVGGITESGVKAQMGCTINPDVGRECSSELTRAGKSKNVVVVGAGPCGMQTAMIAARRGHKVTLLEQEATPGGHVNWISKLPGKGDAASIVRWLPLQLKELKVEVRLDTEATPALVTSLHPDAVIIATGACFARNGISPTTLHPIDGVEADYVLTPEDVLKAGKAVGDNVVIYDDTGYIVGPGLAEMLADQGKQVTFVTSQHTLAQMMEASQVCKVLNARVRPKANVICHHALKSIDQHTLTFADVHTGTQRTIEGVQTVILLTGKQPNETLFHALRGKVPELHIIGDASVARLGPLAMDAAIKAGDAVGRAL